MIRSIICTAMLSLTVFASTSAQVAIQDSLALVALYNATNGDHWKNNENWLIGPVSTWYGITLLGDRVYLIQLYDNGLEGYIPAEIGQFTGLVELDLSKGNFTGGIPDVFGDMPDFYQLSLRDCGLTGEIPSSLGSCSQLGRITLTGNQITGTIPPSLSACKDLIHLLVSNNNLSGPFPPVIHSFDHLEQLELSRNDFTGTIPDWIAELDDLWWLILDDIPFSGPVPFLGDKPNLEYLYLGNNTLTGNLEDILGSYPNLRDCSIKNTMLSGELSPTHFNPNKLVSLVAIENAIHSLGNFTAWANNPNLIRINVASNNLDFDDLLPSSSLPSNKFIYSPQKPIGSDVVISLLPGEAYTIYSPMLDEDIQYQWFFNNQLIPEVVNYDLVIDPFTPELAGDFYYTATHAALPNVILESAITTLEEETTAIGDIQDSLLTIYPNPASDYVIIESSGAASIEHIQLYSSTGQLITHIKSPLPVTTISLVDNVTGVYFLKANSSIGSKVKAIILE